MNSARKEKSPAEMRAGRLLICLAVLFFAVFETAGSSDAPAAPAAYSARTSVSLCIPRPSGLFYHHVMDFRTEPVPFSVHSTAFSTPTSFTPSNILIGQVWCKAQWGWD